MYCRWLHRVSGVILHSRSSMVFFLDEVHIYPCIDNITTDYAERWLRSDILPSGKLALCGCLVVTLSSSVSHAASTKTVFDDCNWGMNSLQTASLSRSLSMANAVFIGSLVMNTMRRSESRFTSLAANSCRNPGKHPLSDFLSINISLWVT